MATFSKEAIEKLLAINGLDTQAPDTEIKALLLAAKWQESEVDTAISVLRENKEHEQEVQTVHQIFRSDEKLSPSHISSLLGITVDYSEDLEQNTDPYNKKGQLTTSNLLSISLIGVGLGVLILFAAMYWWQFGLFHVTGPLSNITF